MISLTLKVKIITSEFKIDMVIVVIVNYNRWSAQYIERESCITLKINVV